MEITESEYIKIMLQRSGVSISELSERLQMSRQNIHNRIRNNNLTLQEFKTWAAALGYDVIIDIKEREGDAGAQG